jgi:hypothetical protein
MREDKYGEFECKILNTAPADVLKEVCEWLNERS